MPGVNRDRPPAGKTDLLRTADLEGGADQFLRRLRDADDPLSLARELPPLDLLYVLREADDEAQVELLALAEREQVQGVIDLTCWKDERPDLAALADLIDPLAMASLEGAEKMLDDMTDELRTLLLKRHAVVHVREDKDDDVPAAEGSELIACPDGYYFIELPRPDDVPDLERQLLAALLTRPFEEYQRELECIRHDLPSELEELAFRWRKGRLADHGFETRAESVELLSPRDPEQARRAIDGANRPPYPLRSDSPLPMVYGRNLEGREVLDRALGALASSDDPAYVERAGVIGAELGAMTSRFLSAIGCDLSDLAAVARGVRAARDTLALGLIAVAGASPERGAQALLTQVPTVLIQSGMGLLAPLRDRARKLLADPGATLGGRAIGLLDEPLAIAVRSLARDLPLRWPPIEADAGLAAGHGEPGEDELEPFSSPEQVRRAEDLIAESERAAELVRDRLGFDEPPGAEGVAASSLVLAALVNLSAGEEPDALPLEADRAEVFARSFLEQDDQTAIGQAVAVLAPSCGIVPEGPLDPAEEREPLRRLLLRSVIIGRRRMADAEPLVFLPLVS